jgi:AcrR family transcriptional regulator
LNVRSTTSIVEAALGRFARDGFTTPLRAIADDAGVSAALIVHHFGSKAGLRTAVDDHVLAIVHEKLHLYDTGGYAAAAALVLPLYEQGDLPHYLRRVLAEGGDAGRRLFDAFVDTTEKALVPLDLDDPRMTASLLVTHTLGTVLMADSIRNAIGVELFSPVGVPRWATAAIGIYRGDLAPLLT